MALALGWKSIDEMLVNMSYVEYQDWQAFYSTEPFPEERADFRNALLTSVMINLKRGKNKAVELEDFVPDYWNERKDKKQTPEQMLANAKMISAMVSGRKEGK